MFAAISHWCACAHSSSTCLTMLRHFFAHAFHAALTCSPPASSPPADLPAAPNHAAAPFRRNRPASTSYPARAPRTTCARDGIAVGGLSFPHLPRPIPHLHSDSEQKPRASVRYTVLARFRIAPIPRRPRAHVLAGVRDVLVH